MRSFFWKELIFLLKLTINFDKNDLGKAGPHAVPGFTEVASLVRFADRVKSQGPVGEGGG